MLERIRRALAEKDLALPAEPLWIAVSGGVDSMVLLHALRTLGHPCSVAHVDHGLRGKDSDADRELVRSYCAEHDIRFRVEKVDVHARVAATGESVQMAARSLRYAWFNELAQKGPFKVATAHHADDVTETFFMGLMQGMGSKGWGSIPARSGVCIRPLLGVSRQEIVAYAKEHDVLWREDVSNADPGYMRNRIRHELFPLFESWRPGTHRNLVRNMRLFGELDALARNLGDEVLAGSPVDAEGVRRVPFERILGATPLLILHHLLRDQGFHPDRFDDVLQAIEQQRTGTRFPGDGVTVFVDRQHLVIAPSVRIPRTWRFTSAMDVPQDALLFMRSHASWDGVIGDTCTAWLDADHITFPLELRPWRDGDRMRPDGLGGSKLISDVLIDAKLPRDRKDRVYVLADAERIIWLCGMRLSEGVKATKASTNVLQLTWSGS